MLFFGDAQIPFVTHCRRGRGQKIFLGGRHSHGPWVMMGAYSGSLGAMPLVGIGAQHLVMESETP